MIGVIILCALNNSKQFENSVQTISFHRWLTKFFPLMKVCNCSASNQLSLLLKTAVFSTRLNTCGLFMAALLIRGYGSCRV